MTNSERLREWKAKNRDHHLGYQRDWAREDRKDPDVRERQNARRRVANLSQEQISSRREQDREWRKRNPDKLRLKHGRRHRRKLDTDINYKIKHRLSCRIRKALHGKAKAANTATVLGCSIESFKMYLESKFETGMSWENYGEWHIDHIVPCAIFDLSEPDHQKRCFHFSNLQPLWAMDNLIKSAKHLDESPDFCWLRTL